MQGEGKSVECSSVCIGSLRAYDQSQCATWAMTNLDIPISEKELFWQM